MTPGDGNAGPWEGPAADSVRSPQPRSQVIALPPDVHALGPSGLRELAALLERQSPAAQARASLDEGAVQELAAMLAGGRKPSIGWWKRHSRQPIRDESPSRPMSMWVVTKLATGMVADGWPELEVADAVVQVAVASGLRQPIAEKACGRGIALGRRRKQRRAS